MGMRPRPRRKIQTLIFYLVFKENLGWRENKKHIVIIIIITIIFATIYCALTMCQQCSRHCQVLTH